MKFAIKRRNIKGIKRSEKKRKTKSGYVKRLKGEKKLKRK